MADQKKYPDRDLIGYGRDRPDVIWPNGAKLAVNIVLNYEEGGEYNILDGDAHSESLICEQNGVEPIIGERNLNVESIYEYGSRCGVWNVFDEFTSRDAPLTVYAVGLALKKNPAVGAAIREHGFDCVSHGWRWIDYAKVPEEVEREHMHLCVDTILDITGERPIGWYTGRPSLNTRRLAVEEGGFLYDSDAYNDDLPYFVEVDGKRHLILCHNFDANDTNFQRSPGVFSAYEYFGYLKNSIEYFRRREKPGFLTIALHARVIGRPGRISAISRLLDYLQKCDDVWLARRNDIAKHWIETQG